MFSNPAVKVLDIYEHTPIRSNSRDLPARHHVLYRILAAADVDCGLVHREQPRADRTDTAGRVLTQPLSDPVSQCIKQSVYIEAGYQCSLLIRKLYLAGQRISWKFLRVEPDHGHKVIWIARFNHEIAQRQERAIVGPLG
jgi:hypothetical protein